MQPHPGNSRSRVMGKSFGGRREACENARKVTFKM